MNQNIDLEEDKTVAMNKDMPAPPNTQTEASMDTQNAQHHRGLDDLEGEIISGRYQIKRRIGKGGMGVVYLADQTNLVREVCIKVLNPALLDDEDALGRFEREAKGLSRLQHPNIVTIFDYGRDGNLAYIVMEYAKGETLSKYLKKHGAMTLDEFLPVAVYTLKGIGEAHKLGLIHRDIKPANLILCELEGEKNFVKILDFGLAKLAQGQEDLTKEQQLVGSASYMSPEQILSGVSDTRTDVYALGVMFYFMLAGKKPFTGANDNAILYQHVNTVPAPLASMLKPEQGVPEALCQVIDQTLSKDPEKRPQTALDLLNAISIALDAPQLRAGFSSMSLARVDLQKASDEAGAQTPSQTAMPAAQAGSGDSISAVIVKNANGTQSVVPVANFTADTTSTFDASAVGRSSRDRTMLIVVLCCVGALVAIVVAALVYYATNKNMNNPPAAEQNIKPQDNDLAVIYDRIEQHLAQGQWQDAETLLESMKDLPQINNSSEHVIKVSDYKKRIEIGKQLADAKKAQDIENYTEAAKLYQHVLERDPENAEANEELKKIQDILNSFSTVKFSLSDTTDTELFVDNVSKGPVSDAIKLNAGKYELKITRPGYVTWEKTVEVQSGDTLTLTVQLQPEKKAEAEAPKPASKPSSGNSDTGLIGTGKSSSKSSNKTSKPSGKKSGLLM